MDELYELTMEIERLRKERDRFLRRSILLEDENCKLKKLLELHGIEYNGVERKGVTIC